MKTYKSLWYVLFTLMLACGAMFTFSSCDDDEEDDNGGSGSGNYTLVGTWKCVSDDADDYLVRTFKKDGTGVEVEYINGKKDNEAQSNIFTRRTMLSFHTLTTTAIRT